MRGTGPSSSSSAVLVSGTKAAEQRLAGLEHRCTALRRGLLAQYLWQILCHGGWGFTRPTQKGSKDKDSHGFVSQGSQAGRKAGGGPRRSGLY